MNDDERVDRLNKLLPEMNQQEKLYAIYAVTNILLEETISDVTAKFIDICIDFEDDSNIISAIQDLANSLVK